MLGERGEMRQLLAVPAKRVRRTRPLLGQFGGRYIDSDAQLPRVLSNSGPAAGMGTYAFHFGYGGRSDQFRPH
jgi:hypothetical protein